MSESEVQAPSEAAEAPGHESPETTTDSPPAAESAGTDESTSESPPPRRRGRSGGGFQRQIAKLTEELAEVRGRLAERETAATPPQEQAPQREEFGDDYEAFLRADAAYAARQAVREEFFGFQEHQQRQSMAQEAAQAEQDYNARLESAYDRYDDFEEVAFSLPVTDAMGQAIFHSELGPDMAYHLGQNRERARQIAAMTPQQQMLAMGRLEGELQAKTKPKAPERSKAPAPPTEVGAGSGGNPADVHDDLPMDVWLDRRYKQLEKGGRRR